MFNNIFGYMYIINNTYNTYTCCRYIIGLIDANIDKKYKYFGQRCT